MNVRAAMLCMVAMLLLPFVVQLYAEIEIYWLPPYNSTWFSVWEPYKLWNVTNVSIGGIYERDEHLVAVLDNNTVVVMDSDFKDVVRFFINTTVDNETIVLGNIVGVDYNSDCDLVAVVYDSATLLYVFMYYQGKLTNATLQSINGPDYDLAHIRVAALRDVSTGSCYVVEWAKDAYDNVVRYFIIDPTNTTNIINGTAPVYVRVKDSNYLIRVVNSGANKHFYVAVLQNGTFNEIDAFTVETVYKDEMDTDPIALRAAVYDSENNAIYIAADQVSVNLSLIHI